LAFWRLKMGPRSVAPKLQENITLTFCVITQHSTVFKESCTIPFLTKLQRIYVFSTCFMKHEMVGDHEETSYSNY
jgi:hypothetical protein